MADTRRKPDWLKIRIQGTEEFRFVRRLVRHERLSTVCEEAKCPNIHECWGKLRTATFMVLGSVCTRACRFCSVATGRPKEVDWDEPARLAEAVREMELRHVVVTMVTRDDLADGGAELLVRVVESLRAAAPDCGIELLISDMQGRERDIRRVAETGVEVLSHNIETVRRLTPLVRSRADYDVSLSVLRIMAEYSPTSRAKSSLMVGLGETREEIRASMGDLRDVGVSILNIGQYLQPTAAQLRPDRYLPPEEFDEMRTEALGLGFTAVESGPLVRSSYHAAEQYRSL